MSTGTKPVQRPHSVAVGPALWGTAGLMAVSAGCSKSELVRGALVVLLRERFVIRVLDGDETATINTDGQLYSAARDGADRFAVTLSRREYEALQQEVSNG